MSRTGDLSNQVVLVTGGGSGIGEAVARRFAQSGARVVIAGRTEDSLRRAAAAMAGSYAVQYQVCDVSNRQQVATLFSWIQANLDSVDVLVNAAGINVANRMMSNLDPEQFDEVMKVNLTGSFNCIYEGLPPMRAKRRGLIVNIVSVAGRRAMLLAGLPYCVSKSAQATLGRFVALEEAEHGVIFFNNVGYLNMCGHGTMGLVVTMAHLGLIPPGQHSVDTPVGVVRTTLDGHDRVTVQNVPSYRYASKVTVEVDGYGSIMGDIAWGGNWFFLVHRDDFELEVANIPELTRIAWGIRHALEAASIHGADGGQIDHIELCGPAKSPVADSRNFVLCPGGAYDRSPCGTGTSARLACLAADRLLAPGQPWRQESIIGSIFEASYELSGDHVIPSITGRAYVTAEATLRLDPQDPFCMGIRS